MDARTAARVLAAGRLALGLGLLVAPSRFARPWFGAEAAAAPSTRVLSRALGVRDVILGAITLHTVDHPEVGPRWLRMCAAADAVDYLATVGARRSLPTAGWVGVGALAKSAAVAGVVLAGQLEAGSTTPAEPPLPPPD
jgi:hypothetical protein